MRAAGEIKGDELLFNECGGGEARPQQWLHPSPRPKYQWTGFSPR